MHIGSFALIWPCLLAAATASLYKDSRSLDLALIFLAMASIALLSIREIRMRAVDWSVLLAGLYEVPALLFSQYRANSIFTLRLIFLSVLLYFAVRLTIRTQIQIACLSGILGFGGAGLAAFALLQFSDNSKRLANAGLTNLVAFRSRLIIAPTPWIPGEWFTLLLLALPFACALPLYLWRKHKNWPAAVVLVPPILFTSALMLSLSRAVFWSTFVFFVAAWFLMSLFKVIGLKRGGLLLASALGIVFLILVAETLRYPGILEAYSGRHTSQIRSTQGRLTIWNRSLEVVRAYPLWGVGSGNGALALTSTADQEETTGFASRIFSLPIQILVEKGIVGFLVYCSFLVLVAREPIRTMRYSPPEAILSPAGVSKKSGGENLRDRSQVLPSELSAHKAMVCCFAAGLIAVLFRELTYSSLFEHQLTLALVAVLCAFLCSPEASN